jgi:threonine dehydrogenase-like Zn-dependent dehydrogenase
MKAAFYDGKGHMEIKDYPDPTPNTGEVVVNIKSTGICGSDLNMNKSKNSADQDPSGHEVAGEIVSVGKGVSEEVIGKRVAVEVLGSGRACNKCWYCRQGQYTHCSNKEGSSSGGFAEYISRKIEGCYPLGNDMTWEEGALVEPLAVSIHGVRIGGLKGGESVAILGSGNIGLTAVAAARELGAGNIFVTSRHKQQSEMAKKLGADYTATPEGDEFEQIILEKTEGRGADLTIETVGGTQNDTLVQSFQVTRRQGRIVILGVFYGDQHINWTKPVLKEQTIQGSICYGLLDGIHDFEMAIDMFSKDGFNLNSMATHKYDLESIQSGFETAYNKKSGSIKVQIHQE